ncbi:MAG TPA: erythromycin esterase family protein, partial [Bacilli bacterium]|nr:erythromycin esterase family protein [Bacilli bacterium]
MTEQHQELIDAIEKSAVRLDDYEDLDALVDAVGDARYVLLGEASHGTSEFYTLRAELSKRLIERKGFDFIAVEGDWPSCYTLNRYIKGYRGAPSTARDAIQDFNRWPTWMWANREVVELAEWLHDFNKKKQGARQVGFYGIDMYSLWESMEEIIAYLVRTGSPELEQARKAFSCFEPYGRSEQNYAVNTAFFSASCEDEVVKLLLDMQKKRGQHDRDDEAALSGE